MKKIVISILFLILCGCDTKPTRIEPDYSKYGSPTTWVYHVEKRISDQLAEKGFVEVYCTEPNDLIAYGIRGTWTNDKDYWSTENLYLRAYDPNIALLHLNDAIYGKLEFQQNFRRATWYYCWSYSDGEAMKKFRDDLIKQYLEKLHNKTD